MTDPYKLLGVSPDASDDEIKKAYRTLVKQYHPDNYHDNPLADLAAEKMKEINEAYDRITRERAGKSSTSSNSSGFYGNYSSSSSSDSTPYGRIRQLIFNNRVAEAEVLLSRIPEFERNAEWYFLNGHLLYKKGWLADARRSFDTACRMDPYNAEYRAALDSMSRGSANSPYTTGRGNGCGNSCDICTGLLCADCCCECMGGDLIGCC